MHLGSSNPFCGKQDIRCAFSSQALSRLKLDAKLTVPSGYAREYACARATFAHARVYDPASKRLVHLNPVPEGFAEGFGGDIDFLGPYPSPAFAKSLAVDFLSSDCFGTEGTSCRRVFGIVFQQSGAG